MHFTAIFIYNPFGIERNLTVFSYKHIFPSGMWTQFSVRHKSDNPHKK
jgi:hypothetical protein